MLTVETKRHIDSARQVLVGKVPDPKQQIDQITNALIYKFMDDMDIKARDAGGQSSFFKGDLEQYAWSKLMDHRKGAQERLNLYTEALEKFSTAQQLPQLFRDIFRQAFLPYRDPETLNLFLKEIEYFDYNHSEELGNAFEYLLSIMGSQGDAGQFRTPRHIIDFIVDVVDPKHNETILDPACGTAGFLISAYKHILEQHDGIGEQGGKNNEVPLTHQQKQKLMENLEGYDISSDMVKLARVNMYLHDCKSPKIYEYDTLTSEERWSDNFDVILANPPFMSPKGGIRPHNKFGVESSRSEVLFVDYIASHLKQNGRAGIIVPEGIIFQSGKAYKQLRKMLVDDHYLAGVISLPAGVFNPYAGVKTSILWLDKDLAKKNQEIIFAQVKNDGFDLGAQRRVHAHNDLPIISAVLQKFKVGELSTQEKIDDYIESEAALLNLGRLNEIIDIKLVNQNIVAKTGDYNLNAARYTIAETDRNQKWPMIKLGKLIKQEFGTRITKTQDSGSLYLVYGGGGGSFLTDNFNRNNDIVISRFAMSEHCVRRVEGQFFLLDSGFTYSIREEYAPTVLKPYVDNILLNIQDRIYACARGHAQKNIDNAQFNNIEIPLPSLEVQKEIIAKLDNYQKIIDGARQIVENYKPSIKTDPSWPIIKIGDVFRTSSGGTPPKSRPEFYQNGTVPWLGSGEVAQGEVRESKHKITEEALKSSSAKMFPINSVLIAMYGATVGQVGILKFKSSTNQAVCAILPNESKALPDFLYFLMKGHKTQLIDLSTGGAQPNISQQIIRNFTIPLPSLSEQEALLENLIDERKIIEANERLIRIYEQKIKAKIAEV